MGKKMRLAHIFASDATQPGGVQTHVYFLTKALEARGHKITVFGCGEPSFYHFTDYENIGQAFPTPTPNGNWTTLTLGGKKTTSLLWRLDKKEFDICHIHEPYTPFINWQIIKQVKNVPVVATFHTGWDEQSLANMLNPILPLFKPIFSGKSTKAIFVSKIAKKRWQPLCGPNVNKSVIPNGVDHSLYFPLKKTKSSKRIELLFIARLVPRKGLLPLLEAVTRLKKENSSLKLTVIGDGPQRPKAQEYIKRESLQKAVTLLGQKVSQARKIHFLQNADIFCAPYVDESFGITVLEAMACGCPIVGFQNSAFQEILSNYPAPELLVKPKEVGGLALALKKIIHREKLYQTLRAWCIKESQKYNWEKVARKTENMYYP